MPLGSAVTPKHAMLSASAVPRAAIRCQFSRMSARFTMVRYTSSAPEPKVYWK